MHDEFKHHKMHVLDTPVHSLTSDATVTLIHAFITARLDYCSSLYAGLPVELFQFLYRVLRSSARLSGRTPKFRHVSNYISSFSFSLRPTGIGSASEVISSHLEGAL